MGARKLLYHVPLIWGNKEIVPKKMALISKGNTGNFSENSSKNCLDYYPYGMLLPNRHDPGNEYRYGFQGQEMDNEIKGEGNSINYKYRMHSLFREYGNPRVGRFFAVDPLAAQYPHYSPYSFSGNEVINRVELEGLEPSKEMASQDPGLNAVKATNAEKIQYKTSKAMMLAAGSGPFAFAIAYYGTEALVAILIEEGIEYVIEESTGIPIIVKPIDVIENITKNGIKKSTKKLITDLKPKKNIPDHIVKNYAKKYESLSLKKILKDFTGNAKGVANTKGTKTI